MIEHPCDDCPSTCCGEFGDYGLTPWPDAQKECAAYQTWTQEEASP